MLDIATYTAPRQSNKSRSRGYLGHKRSTWERADLAARAYMQRRPIESPTLQQLAFAYRVSVASIQRRLSGKCVTVSGWVTSPSGSKSVGDQWANVHC